MKCDVEQFGFDVTCPKSMARKDEEKLTGGISVRRNTIAHRKDLAQIPLGSR